MKPEACIQEANNPSVAFRETVRMTHFEMQAAAAQMESSNTLSTFLCVAERDCSDVAEATNADGQA
jgi:hypothetical protein